MISAPSARGRRLIDVEVRGVTATRCRAATAVTRSSCGIRPYSALLGALKVRYDVAVQIEVALEG